MFPQRPQALIIERQGTGGRLRRRSNLAPSRRRPHQHRGAGVRARRFRNKARSFGLPSPNLGLEASGRLTRVSDVSIFIFHDELRSARSAVGARQRLPAVCARGEKPGPSHQAVADISAKTINRGAA